MTTNPKRPSFVYVTYIAATPETMENLSAWVPGAKWKRRRLDEFDIPAATWCQS